MNAVGRILAAPLLALGLSEAAFADAPLSGRETLPNGATLVWRVGEPAPAALGLAVPAFAGWTPDGFAEPVEIRLSAASLATVDAWQLGFYRAGDTGYARPLRRFRGTALSLHAPLSWDGRIDGGPPLRPGERLVALLEVRDAAGNVERAPPQEMLVARYRMRRETRRARALDADRAEALRDGAAPENSVIPARGRAVSLRLEGWTGDDPPRISGLPLAREDDGDVWTVRQVLPGGTYDLVVQVARPLRGGVMGIPVGAVRVEVPPGAPLLAAVKGTGALDRVSHPAPPPLPEGLRRDRAVPGAGAARLVLTDREVGEDRLALALVDPAAPAALAKDRRKRRSLLVEQGARTALWAGEGGVPAPPRAPDAVPSRRVAFTRRGAPGAMLDLPHADILPGSLRLSVEGETDSLVAGRDYAADLVEGRVLLRAALRERLSRRTDPALRIAYEVHAFAPRNDTAAPDGPAGPETWNGAAARPAPAGGGEPDRTLLRRLLDWFGGGT